MIQIDAAFRDRLLTAGEAEFRDETGRVIGRFTPIADPTRVVDEDLGMTDLELRDALDPNRKTFTTAEVLAHVRGLS